MDEHATIAALVAAVMAAVEALKAAIGHLAKRNGRDGPGKQMDMCRDCHSMLGLMEQRAKETHDYVDEIRQDLGKARAVQLRQHDLDVLRDRLTDAMSAFTRSVTDARRYHRKAPDTDS